MENLLPLEEKIRTKKEYRFRAIGVFLLMAALLQAVGIVFLLPAYFLSVSKEEDVRARHVEGISKEDEQVFSKLKRVQDKISFLQPRTSISFREVLGIFLKHVSSDLKITSFSVEQSESSRVIALKGKAASRDALLKFSRDIKAEKNIESFDIPVANYAQEKDIEFSTTVRLVYKKP